MYESGGRRIKRTLRIDASSVRFLSDAEIQSLRPFTLLTDYLDDKRSQLEASNKALGPQADAEVNRRRLTNLGTFRAYALAYLQQQREVHQDMLMIVRMMEPESQGIPVEVYCFANKTAWVDYERIQGDIFDHLLAILPELWLRLYQAPSGGDFSRAWPELGASVSEGPDRLARDA
jgi:miniconductance mechanosensitive channel